MTQWIKLANFSSGLEADITVERLRSAGLHAEARGNDVVGIVGPGFQGTTGRGVDVLVLDSEIKEARELLADLAEPEA
jgi:hypothetical protein